MVEFPHPVFVKPHTSNVRLPHPRLLWAVDTFGRENFILREGLSNTTYWFKREEDALMFSLRWS